MNSVLVSIITVCFNSEKYIEQTIKSVVSQTYGNIEYIIVDGKSTDSTLEIIERYSNKYPHVIKYISEADTGIYNAMNKGISMSTGELIGIINSDDWYEQTAIEQIINAYCLHGPAVYHGIQRTYSNDMLVELQCTNSTQLVVKMIEHPTCFLHKSLYLEYGVFDESYHYVGDYELMLRLRKFGVPFIIIESVIANFRQGGASHTAKAIWENYRLWLDLGLLSRSDYVYRSVMDRIRLFMKRGQYKIKK
ncbi:glycosyltransferase [Spirosoma sp. RP8]|uniref:Glycosyltransferase n=1 Tax=Spirosoma liriopis TaxID=2937440 RepID=A0ABT0HJG6_9BACT|nr:glycosyltransferase family 2 protein [Spirosoma liriopis]MCK8492299.1 glycosyltransferase [Spirosoma liriopis]